MDSIVIFKNAIKKIQSCFLGRVEIYTRASFMKYFGTFKVEICKLVRRKMKRRLHNLFIFILATFVFELSNGTEQIHLLIHITCDDHIFSEASILILFSQFPQFFTGVMDLLTTFGQYFHKSLSEIFIECRVDNLQSAKTM